MCVGACSFVITVTLHSCKRGKPTYTSPRESGAAWSTSDTWRCRADTEEESDAISLETGITDVNEVFWFLHVLPMTVNSLHLQVISSQLPFKIQVVMRQMQGYVHFAKEENLCIVFWVGLICNEVNINQIKFSSAFQFMTIFSHELFYNWDLNSLF